MLPSEHDGGDVIVHCGNQKLRLPNSDSGEFSFTYGAWYTDVGHDIQPVTTGCSLVLMYDLIHHNAEMGEIRPSTVLEDNRSTIESALEALKEYTEAEQEEPQQLIYLFECEYASLDRGLRSLAGKDQVRSLHLHDACHQKGFYMFLAQLEYSNEQQEYETDYPDEGQIWTLKTLFTSEGDCIVKDLTVDKTAIIQDDPFDNAFPDDEQYEGWGSHEEKTCIEIYRRSCLVIAPQASRNRKRVHDAEGDEAANRRSKGVETVDLC